MEKYQPVILKRTLSLRILCALALFAAIGSLFVSGDIIPMPISEGGKLTVNMSLSGLLIDISFGLLLAAALLPPLWRGTRLARTMIAGMSGLMAGQAMLFVFSNIFQSMLEKKTNPYPIFAGTCIAISLFVILYESCLSIVLSEIGIERKRYFPYPESKLIAWNEIEKVRADLRKINIQGHVMLEHIVVIQGTKQHIRLDTRRYQNGVPIVNDILNRVPVNRVEKY